jgi:cell division topological specificity factor
VSIFDYFVRKKPKSASLAKERLQVIVAHERSARKAPKYLEKMQKEIIEVIKKYIAIDDSQVSVKLDNNDKHSILELNVSLPEK